MSAVCHNFSLSTKTDDRNFIISQLFLDSYCCVVALTIVFLYISHSNVHSCGLFSCSIKLYYYYFIIIIITVLVVKQFSRASLLFLLSTVLCKSTTPW